MSILSAANHSNTQDVEDYLEQVPEITGLEPDFDRIVEDPSLSTENPAATLHTTYGGSGTTTDFLKNPYSFQKLGEREGLVATVHEVLEEKQFNGFIGDELKETHGISEEFRDFLNYAQVEFPNSIREGMTQALTNKLVPEGDKIGKRFYPEETDIFETLVEGMGFDLEEELLDEDEIVDNYSKEVFHSSQGENFYYETGEFEGVKYDFMAIGDNMGDYGPEIAEDYIPKALETGNDLDSGYVDVLETGSSYETPEMPDYGLDGLYGPDPGYV